MKLNAFLLYLETGLSAWVNDADLTSIYPSIMRAFNTSRMTLSFVPYELEGKEDSDLRRYFANLINVKENAVPMGVEFLGFPSYTTIIGMMQEKLATGSSIIVPKEIEHQMVHSINELDELIASL